MKEGVSLSAQQALSHGRCRMGEWNQFGKNWIELSLIFEYWLKASIVDCSYLMIMKGVYRCLQALVSHWSVDAEA
jgi:hypothetical protein